jgi:C4-type Zn-finger protein
MSALIVTAEEAQIILSSLTISIEQQKAFHGYVDPTLAGLAAKVSEQLTAKAAEPAAEEVKQVSVSTKKTKAEKQ